MMFRPIIGSSMHRMCDVFISDRFICSFGSLRLLAVGRSSCWIQGFLAWKLS